MNAQAKCGMAVLLAIDHDLVRIREHRGVTIGGGKRQQHHVAGLYRATADDSVLHHLARHRYRRVGAQQFLHGGRNQFRLRDQTLAIRWRFRQMPQRRADRAPSGVDAGDQQQPQRTHHMHVGERLPVLVSGIHQRRDQIVRPVLLALLDVNGEISGHLMDGAHQGGIVLDAELKDFVDPFDEEIAVLFGDAEHMRDGPNRDVLGIARRRVAFSLTDEFVDQLVADRADPGLQLLHGVGRERWQQQLLCRLVVRRVRRDRRCGIGDFWPDVAHNDAA